MNEFAICILLVVMGSWSSCTHQFINDLIITESAQSDSEASILRVDEPSVKECNAREEVEDGNFFGEFKGRGGTEADVDMHATGEVWEDVEKVGNCLFAGLGLWS